jgi:hypothetical protein
MLRRVALGRADVSVELIAFIIRVIKIGELGMLAAISNRSTLRRNTRATRSNIPEDGILNSHRRENLRSYENFLREMIVAPKASRYRPVSSPRRSQPLFSQPGPSDEFDLQPPNHLDL